MTFYQQPSGPNNVLEYQASGLPYVTQSATPSGAGNTGKVEFPFVTKFFFVKNIGPAPLDVGFTQNGVLGTNKMTLPVSGTYSGDIRVVDLHFYSAGTATNYEVVAGLTGIPRRSFPRLTGSLDVFSGSAQDTHGYNGLGYVGIG